jgi:hypothetical protein
MLALLPPLWRAVMDRRLDRYLESASETLASADGTGSAGG